MVDLADILRSKILIVDDQPANILLLERILRGAGYLAVESTMDSRPPDMGRSEFVRFSGQEAAATA